MKNLTIILFILLTSGCTKHYTNEECVKEVCKRLECDQYDRADRDFAEIGISFQCSKNNNDPNKTLKASQK